MNRQRGRPLGNKQRNSYLGGEAFEGENPWVHPARNKAGRASSGTRRQEAEKAWRRSEVGTGIPASCRYPKETTGIEWRSLLEV